MSDSTTTDKPHFASIATAPPDAILGLTEAFKSDPREDKMNLSVGVYKDASGNTPILRSVKAAEQWLIEHETTKGYLPIEGSADYRRHIQELVFAHRIDHARIVTLDTPGGTGGLRVAAGFLRRQLGGPTVWMPQPTWANHGAIFSSEDLRTEGYRYLASDQTSLDFASMIDDLSSKPRPGDAVLLHACCHNPTGIDPTAEQWRNLAMLLRERRLLPLIDFAYQGFGDGLQEDAAGLHAILESCQEAIVCNSFSKNFGLYSERVGAISVVAASPEQKSAVLSQLKRLVRSNYSNPPRHGAAIVATILNDPQLSAQWSDELDEMRERINGLRTGFVETMKSAGRGHDFSFLLPQKGMFSYSGLTPLQVDQLRSERAVYIVGSGRINVAGMSEQRMPWLCDAIAAVLES